MLIDSTHKKWLIASVSITVAAVIGHRILDLRTPGGLTGGSFVGLWYGVVGAALMIYAGLLSAMRKMPKASLFYPRKTWLRGHLWLGTLSLVFILCHSNYSWGGPLEIVLWIVLIGVIVTGFFGVVVQQVLPRLLTSRVPTEAPYEQIPHLCEVMQSEADTLVDKVCGPYNPAPTTLENTVAVMQYASNTKAQLRDFYEHDIRPFLAPQVPRKSPLLNPIQVEARFSKLRKLPGMEEVGEEVAQLAKYCEERRLMLEQERIHFWLHAWLLVHVPLSVALLVLSVTHIVTALYY